MPCFNYLIPFFPDVLDSVFSLHAVTLFDIINFVTCMTKNLNISRVREDITGTLKMELPQGPTGS